MNRKGAVGGFFRVLVVLLFFSLPPQTAWARDSEPEETTPRNTGTYPEQEWGFGFVWRTAQIPYSYEAGWVGSLVPLFYFEGQRIFLDGVEGGIKLLDRKRFRLDLLGRFRFHDIPKEEQNRNQKDALDLGLRFRFRPRSGLNLDAELLSDDRLRWHANLGLEQEFEYGRLQASPFLNLRYKSREFNDYYFGLDRDDEDQGLDLSLGLETSFHLWRNLYLMGGVRSTWFVQRSGPAAYLEKDWVTEFQAGFAIRSEKGKPRKRVLGLKPYLRLAHGLATPADISEIFRGKGGLDDHHNQLSSLFFGYPLSDEVFGLPLDLYLTAGFISHWKSEVQPWSQEYVLAIKAYYPFHTPIGWRLGLAHGLSYLSGMTYVESCETKGDGYEPSRLMSYLDFSADLSLGDLFGCESWRELFFGFAIHHRSGIFEASSQFGRIKGGCNYLTLYLQYHF